MSLTHPLRPSVMRADEWFKDRDQGAWQQTKKQVLQRDQFTCTYCRLVAQKFQQVNHIGAEDDHQLENLETVCAACHRVLHLGASAGEGILTVFECKPDLVDMAVIVRLTRALVSRQTSWPEIERYILDRFALPGGRQFTQAESVAWANRLLHSIQPPAYRAVLPKGLAVLFHEAGDWNGFPERIWLWQCLKGNRYAEHTSSSGTIG
jgi:hypothetical protein